MTLYTFGDPTFDYGGFPGFTPWGLRVLGQFGNTGGGSVLLESGDRAWREEAVNNLFEINNGKSPQKPNLPIPFKAARGVAITDILEVFLPAVNRASTY